ncbi:ABC transporter permease [Paramixta manurensis]|uniref:ABC transporter permease n=1 Tax=Paramixta manurensis TaxID=2740817 RepID=A0A6M8U5Z3_9GAMM|nr:ABC transporter permease [Erwiniaceae bacterium PD-1]
MKCFQRQYCIFSIFLKELIEIRRDKITLLMIFAIPIVNLFILGFSVNSDPREVRTALIDHDRSSLSRTLIAGMTNTEYFAVRHADSEKQATQWFQQGNVQFVVVIPAGFGKALLAEKQPSLYVQTDATDPAATANATQALIALLDTVFSNDTKAIPELQTYGKSLVSPVIHKMFNPEGVARFNVVPGLIGVILSIILILMTSLSVLRERERGSIIHIINSPATALDLLLGKTLPYFLVGALQAVLIVSVATLIMRVPLHGAWFSLGVLIGLFILLSLAVGIIFSTITSSQLQAMQLSSFYFLISTMLSGFMTPFFGMPGWSQFFGSLLPMTWFLRLVRGVMLKGYTLSEMSNDFILLTALTFALVLLAYFLFSRALRRV